MGNVDDRAERLAIMIAEAVRSAPCKPGAANGQLLHAMNPTGSDKLDALARRIERHLNNGKTLLRVVS
jgi:hypothetical protein